MSSMAWGPVLCCLCSLAILLWFILSVVALICFMLQFLCHHTFWDVCRWFYVVDIHLHTSYFFMFCLFYFVLITHLPQRDLGQACILIWLYIVVFWGESIEVSMIMLPGWLLVLPQMHLFLSIVALFHYKISCMHLLLWWILLYQIASGM